MQVICWVLGEYGTLADIPVESVIDKMAAILDTQKATDAVRGFLVTAFGKLCSQAGCRLTPQAEEVLHDAANSRNLDLQQHALEISALLRYGCSGWVFSLKDQRGALQLWSEQGIVLMSGT